MPLQGRRANICHRRNGRDTAASFASSVLVDTGLPLQFVDRDGHRSNTAT
jgi:hypothetical protein